MTSSPRARSSGASFAALVLVAGMLPVPAAAVDWSGLGGDNNWSTAGNWAGGVAPASANTTLVTFGAAGTTFTPVADAPWVVNRMDITGATAYLLTGGIITLDGTAPQVNVSGGAHGIANDLLFATTTTFTNTVDLTMTGVVGGVAGLTKAGSGRLILANPLVYSGPTTVSAGTLQVGNGAAGPNTFLSPIVVDTAIEFAGSGSTVNLGNGISGTGTVTVSGGTVVSTAAALTHQGATTITGASLTAFIVNSALVTVGAGGSWSAGDSSVGSIAGTGAIDSGGTAFTVGSDGTSTTFSGNLSGAGGLTKVGAGRLTLANLLMYSGTTTVNGGTLQIGNGAAGPNTFLSPIVVNAAIEFAGSGSTVNLGNGISGTGSVTVSGGTVVSTAAALTHQGTTTISGASLTAFIVNSALVSVGAGGNWIAGDSSVGAIAGTGAINIGGTALTVGTGGASSTFSGNFSGAGGLTKVGAGSLTLANFLMYSGTTTVSAGTLQVGDGAAGPNSFFSPIVVNSAIDFAGSGSTVTLGNGISGTGTVTVSGGSVVSNAAALTHAGTTTISGGSLTAFIVNNARLTVGAGATWVAGDSTIGSLAGAGTITDSGTAITVGGDGTSTTFSGPIGGAGGLTKVGAGILTLSGVSTFTGTKTINGGSILLTGSMPGPVVVNFGGTLGGTGTVSGPVTVNAGGTLAPGLSPGVINTGNLNLAGGASIEIQGTVLGTQYDNINVTGSVTIAGGTLTLLGAYVPVAGNTFTIITNDAADPVVGTFAGLAEGATIAFNGATLRITYVGGTGNDVVLSVLAAPAVAPVAVPTLSQWALVLLAALVAGLGLRRRASELKRRP